MDLTYLVTTDRGPCPLALVQNACTRELVGYGFFPSCGAMKAADVADAAVLSRFPRTGGAERLVLLTDGGPQFGVPRLQDRMQSLEITLQASFMRWRESNGMVESTNGHLKGYSFWFLKPTAFLETWGRVDGVARNFNERRPRSSLNLSPKTQPRKGMEEEEV